MNNPPPPLLIHVLFMLSVVCFIFSAVDTGYQLSFGASQLDAAFPALIALLNARNVVYFSGVLSKLDETKGDLK